MALWKNAILGLARNPALARAVRETPALRQLCDRYVPGTTVDSAIEAAQGLVEGGYTVGLRLLSPPPVTADRVGPALDTLVDMFEALAESGLGVAVVTDILQMGLAVAGEDADRQLERRLGGLIEAFHEAAANSDRRAGGGVDDGGRALRHLLTLDVDGLDPVEGTMGVRSELARAAVPAAATVQAYLVRGQDDVKALISERAAIRLIEGVPPPVRIRAHAEPREIRANYLRLARLMLSEEAMINRAYPIFVVNDGKLAKAVLELIERSGWTDPHEFELPYGHRPALQAAIHEQGHPVRVVIPFGPDWVPYVTRLAG